MRNVMLPWKEFNISIPAVLKQIEADHGEILSSQADSKYLIIQLKDADADIDAIKSYWESLGAASSEAKNYNSRQDFEKALKTCKESLLDKAWSAITKTEKKILMNLELDHIDRQFIVEKYGDQNV